jgi:hypothetical protein
VTTISERKHMSRVAQLGCAVCFRLGLGETPAELHHPRRGAGMAYRAKHADVIPLCPEHHRGRTGVHGLGTKGFEAHYGFDEAALLADTIGRLA